MSRFYIVLAITFWATRSHASGNPERQQPYPCVGTKCNSLHSAIDGAEEQVVKIQNVLRQIRHNGSSAEVCSCVRLHHYRLRVYAIRHTSVSYRYPYADTMRYPYADTMLMRPLSALLPPPPSFPAFADSELKGVPSISCRNALVRGAAFIRQQHAGCGCSFPLPNPLPEDLCAQAACYQEHFR